jgi:hypothetical protein
LQAAAEGILAASERVDLRRPAGARDKLPRQKLLDGDANPQIVVPGQISRAETTPPQQTSDFELPSKDATSTQHVARASRRCLIFPTLRADLPRG